MSRLDRRRFLERMGAVTAASLGLPGAAEGLAAGSDAGDRGMRSGRPLPAPPPPGRDLQDVPPEELTVAEASALIRDGALSPVTLVEAYLARIEALDARLMAFNTVTGEAALDRARRLEGEAPRGPLHGIPLALKDNFHTAGVPTTANSRIFEGFVPEYDATAWARLRAAGAILLGKTQMGPLATTSATTPEGVQTTVNAWASDDPDVSPGGSSSGSATAVAARLAAGATGTQTGGSITNPANAQGLTGLKPTMGRISLRGIIPLTYTRDHPGPLARDAVDAALLLQAMAGPDTGDPRTLGLPPVPDLVRAATPYTPGGRPRLRGAPRVGVPPGYLDPPEAPDLEDPDELADVQSREAAERRRRRAEARHARALAEVAVRRTMLDDLRGLGARVVEVELPDDWDALTAREVNNVRLPERTEPFLRHLREDVRRFGVSLSPWINGLLLGGAEYVRGQRAKLLLLRRILEDVFEQCDVVLQTSPIPFDMVGLPLIAFPNGMVDGRPSGAVLGGPPYEEDRLLGVVAGYQAVTDWHARRPEESSLRGGGGGAGWLPPVAPPAPRPRLELWDVVRDGA